MLTVQQAKSNSITLYAILQVERNSGGDINNHCGRSYISGGSRGYITRGGLCPGGGGGGGVWAGDAPRG